MFSVLIIIAVVGVVIAGGVMAFISNPKTKGIYNCCLCYICCVAFAEYIYIVVIPRIVMGDGYHIIIIS